MSVVVDRALILSQFAAIETAVLTRHPEMRPAFDTATRKGRADLMKSTLRPHELQKYAELMQSLDALRLSVAA